ncbi:FMN-binding negative transcriptional regulator [Sphingomicrobium nitratireducens]|uniref:FMN-binding negative transcriptional regulator n=1 Tax=Sphingomicrobium nitratireducens TaxID=2964666 RepID=UPI00223EE18E|nr:FMN-binding negative transcriptional regulator [Sphingomicrobium nitratireducens]
MHPNPAFAWRDRDEMMGFVGEQAFATLVVEGAGIAYAPLQVEGETIRFHLARRNPLVERLESAHVTASVMGPHAYHSAQWYESEQVPTWLYAVVEVAGIARRLDEAALAQQVLALSDRMERTYMPEDPWTHDKMKPGAFEAMLKAIVGFEFPAETVRGVRKFNQHKDAADIAASIAAQQSAGRDDIATWIGALAP